MISAAKRLPSALDPGHHRGLPRKRPPRRPLVARVDKHGVARRPALVLLGNEAQLAEDHHCPSISRAISLLMANDPLGHATWEDTMPETRPAFVARGETCATCTLTRWLPFLNSGSLWVIAAVVAK